MVSLMDGAPVMPVGVEPPRKRSSRWDSAPVLDRGGKPKLAAITERDIEGIFKPLTRYRYLPADYLHAFAGGSLDYLSLIHI